VNARRSTTLFVLGASSGLPLFLTSKTLQAWMTNAGTDIRSIGLFSLASLPYSLKFLWAPLLDRYRLPFGGRRRGWILASQILLALAVAAMACTDPRTALAPLAAAAVLVAFLSATQDIAFEAWRVDVLPPESRGSGASIAVLGYRAALLLTGAGALVWSQRIGWRTTYLLLALLQVLLGVATLLAPEPEGTARAPSSLRDAVVQPFAAFVRSRGFGAAAIALGFVATFKWGVYLVSSASTPFLLAQGYSNAEVGTVLGGAGLVATLAGTAAGGFAMTRLSVRAALWAFGGLQGICGLLFWALALQGRNPSLMAAAVVSENFFVGMGSAALVAWMLGECDPRFSATQFALLSSLMAFSRDVLTAPWGWLSKALGWPGFFLVSLAACLPGLLLLALAGGRRPDSATSGG
jgi:PAT family beta-lactamase induction signal transducer AmpG